MKQATLSHHRAAGRLQKALDIQEPPLFPDKSMKLCQLRTILLNLLRRIESSEHFTVKIRVPLRLGARQRHLLTQHRIRGGTWHPKKRRRNQRLWDGMKEVVNWYCVWLIVGFFFRKQCFYLENLMSLNYHKTKW